MKISVGRRDFLDEEFERMVQSQDKLEQKRKEYTATKDKEKKRIRRQVEKEAGKDLRRLERDREISSISEQEYLEYKKRVADETLRSLFDTTCDLDAPHVVSSLAGSAHRRDRGTHS